MIEISHKQARYLLRESEDRRLPDEQWAALQTHLESCKECCAYRDQLTGLEKNLRRGLHGRWGAAHPALKDLPNAVVDYRASRRLRRRRSLYAIVVILFVLAVATFRWYKIATAPVPPPTPVPVPTPDPIQTSRFRGLIAYQASPAGNSDIFLLNISGTSPNESINLTHDPAQDTDPAWSPDGEWIAFLSDRSGKRELYVINVAGTRTTQLTNDPQVDWQGPLSWSMDGKMIGLVGRREAQNGFRWLYVVPLAGTGPASLPGTRNAPGWVHFSPTQTLLATSINIFDYFNDWSLNNWYGLPTNEDTHVTGLPYGAEVDFDWGPGGNSLVYLFDGSPQGEKSLSENQIRVSPVFGLNNRDSNDGYTSEIAARAPAGSMFRSVIYVPDAMTGGPHLATLIDLNNTGCWTVRMINLVVYNQPAPIDFPGLCVENPLERSSWQTSGSGKAGRWLVLTARTADKVTGKPSGAPGLYAIYAGMPIPKSAPEYERLADLPKGSLGTTTQRIPVPQAVSIPRTRPSGKSLNIQPVSVKPTDGSLIAPIQPPADAGILLAAEMDVTQSINSNILRLNINGVGQTILPGRHALNCPTWSPDRQFIAFTALDNSNQYEIFVMNGDGGSPIQRTQPYQPGISSAQGFDCPAWSPNGELMAAVRYDVDGAKLEIIGRDEGVLRIVPVNSPSKTIRPVWTPDGKTVLLAEDANGVNPAAVVAIDWLSSAGAYNLNVLDGWKNVLRSGSSSDGRENSDGSIQKILNIKAMSLSPDGKQLALITTRAADNQQTPTADFLVYTMRETTADISAELKGYNLQAMKTPDRMVWQPDHTILFALPDNLLSSNKAVFASLDLTNSQFQTLAFTEDILYDWGWKDGWLVYSCESGVWVQKVDPPKEAGNEPLRIFEQAVSSLEIK